MSTAGPAARIISGALGLAATLVAGAAQAQDPFGMLEAYGAMSAQAQYASGLHSRYRDDDDDDEGSSRPPSPGLTLEEANALQAAMREQEALENAELERWRMGFWQFFQSRDPADPGAYRAARFQNPQAMITLTGLDETWEVPR